MDTQVPPQERRTQETRTLLSPRASLIFTGWVVLGLIAAGLLLPGLGWARARRRTRR